MAKAGTPKKKKAKPKLTEKEQSERFKETAREFGVEESGESVSSDRAPQALGGYHGAGILKNFVRKTQIAWHCFRPVFSEFFIQQILTIPRN
jgi:hypothetical protein